MNKEFVNLDNNTSIVKDDDGKTKKRDTKVNDKILILENKIKKTDEEIEMTKTELENSKKYLDNLKEIKNILMFSAIISSAALGGMFGIAMPSIIFSLLLSASTAAIISNIVIIKYAAALDKAERQVIMFETRLKEEENLKSEFEKELELSKEMLLKEDTKIDLEPVSLKEKNEIELPKVEEKIEERTEEALEKEQQKQKKLTL